MYKLGVIGKRCCGISVVAGSGSWVGAVEQSIGPQAVPHRPCFLHQRRYVGQRPYVHRARLKRDQKHIGQYESRPKCGRVPATGINDDVVELTPLLLNLGTQNWSVWVLGTGQARRPTCLGPKRHGCLRRSLSVAVDQPYITTGKRAGKRDLDS